MKNKNVNIEKRKYDKGVIKIYDYKFRNELGKFLYK